jgi:hypothetical protein
MAINTRELRCGRSIERFSNTVQAVIGILERFLETLVCLDHCFVTTETVERLTVPSRLGQTRVGDIDMNQPWMGWVSKALVALSTVRAEFTASDLAQ